MIGSTEGLAQRIWTTTFVDLSALLLALLVLVFATTRPAFQPDRAREPAPNGFDAATSGSMPEVTAPAGPPTGYLAQLIHARLGGLAAGREITFLTAGDEVILEMPPGLDAALEPAGWPGMADALAALIADPAARVSLEAMLPEAVPLAPALAELRILARSLATAGLATGPDVMARRDAATDQPRLRLIVRHDRTARS